jgi:hypothetical protein
MKYWSCVLLLCLHTEYFESAVRPRLACRRLYIVYMESSGRRCVFIVTLILMFINIDLFT